MRHHVLSVFSLFFVAACGPAVADQAQPTCPECTTAPPAAAVVDPARHPALLATLYGQTAAEVHAVTRAMYWAAEMQIDGALKDKKWTAALEQEGKVDPKKKPAIILDVDETVLDNSRYMARLVHENKHFAEGWNDWCNEAAAAPIAGALELTKYAASKGITVFYVTNREHVVEEATRKNLETAGFPFAADVDVLLTVGEKPEWTSDKTSRRASIAENYRILMLFGDNMGDFVSRDVAHGSDPASRDAVVQARADMWGKKWFMLPNPMYGYWDSVTFGHDDAADDATRGQARLKALRP